MHPMCSFQISYGLEVQSVSECCLSDDGCVSGQHLLSAVVEQLVGADKVRWELPPSQPETAPADTVTIDLSVPSLTPQHMSEIEAQCNAHIRAAHQVRQLVLDGSSEGHAERQKVIERGQLRGKLPRADVIQVCRQYRGRL